MHSWLQVLKQVCAGSLYHSRQSVVFDAIALPLTLSTVPLHGTSDTPAPASSMIVLPLAVAAAAVAAADAPCREPCCCRYPR